jgi:ribosomal protein L29
MEKTMEEQQNESLEISDAKLLVVAIHELSNEVKELRKELAEIRQKMPSS